MKLLMTLLVRDEEDIVRENIDYHLSRGVDCIIAMDNRSCDATSEILKEYQQKGVLHYIYQSDDDYSQDLWVSRMAELAAEKYHADWVMHVDADEFWWPSRGKNLKEIFEGCPKNVDALLFKRVNFIPPSEYHPGLPFHSQLTYREVASLDPKGNPLPGKVCHRGFSNVHVQQGNHGLSSPEAELVLEDSDAATILHFPYRSYMHFRNKIRKGGAAYARNTRFTENIGWTWRNLHKLESAGLLKQHYDGQTLTQEELLKRAQSGDLIHDLRLHAYLADLYSSNE